MEGVTRTPGGSACKVGTKELKTTQEEDPTHLSPVLETTDDNMVGMTANIVRRLPAQTRAFWGDVRAKLWIDDGEIEPARIKVASKRPDGSNDGKKVLASRLDDINTYYNGIRADKLQISMMPSAERR